MGNNSTPAFILFHEADQTAGRISESK